MNNPTLQDERRTTYPMIEVKARCLKCPGLGIHFVSVRHDPGRMLYEFCPHHRGLRQLDYFPELPISPEIRIV